MSEADKMFEELGYIKIKCEEGFFYHNPTNDNAIFFDCIKKRVASYSYEDYLTVAVEMDEMKAINKKCEEMGW